MKGVVVGQPEAGKSCLLARLSLPPRRLQMVELASLTAAVHPDPAVRRAQAAALQHLLGARLVVHVVDAAALGRMGRLDEADIALSLVAQQRPHYLVVAAKADLPGAGWGFSLLRRQLAGVQVVPASARSGQGTRALRARLLAVMI